MVSSAAVLSLLWIGWLLSWLLASGWTTRTIIRQSPGSRIVQSLPIWIGALLLFRQPDNVLAAPLLRPRPWLGWIAVLIATLCFAMTWWARIHLGRLWSAAVTVKADHVLVRSGPYRLTRHPIYTGLLVALSATALARNSLAALVGIGLIALGLVLKLRQEEQFLLAQFGAAYVVYKRPTSYIRRMFQRSSPECGEG
jgi:protein-S-isoprenylcysteine O-methyltransferase Ste14